MERNCAQGCLFRLVAQAVSDEPWQTASIFRAKPPAAVHVGEIESIGSIGSLLKAGNMISSFSEPQKCSWIKQFILCQVLVVVEHGIFIGCFCLPIAMFTTTRPKASRSANAGNPYKLKAIHSA